MDIVEGYQETQHFQETLDEQSAHFGNHLRCLELNPCGVDPLDKHQCSACEVAHQDNHACALGAAYLATPLERRGFEEKHLNYSNCSDVHEGGNFQLL